ncbi:hypothetical protein [Streptomyces sp. NPDC051079]|uniref:hypothetical protein n=1 Tax=Streptomyces sp. NPDC051079 TaxID=3155043 RepID=UPI00344FFF21
MGKRDTVKAAKSYARRDTQHHPDPPATQSSLGDRHTRQNSPERLYPGPAPEDEVTE